MDNFQKFQKCLEEMDDWSKNLLLHYILGRLEGDIEDKYADILWRAEELKDGVFK